MSLNTLFSAILESPERHAQWLNTASFLEYIGFRKIVKSQLAQELTGETLGHAIEEGQHALRLKQLAIRVGGPRFQTYASESLLCGVDAEEYFQTVDRLCEEDLGESQTPFLSYLYVTWLVELRALLVYNEYQVSLEQTGHKFHLKGLLTEERAHLSSVESDLKRVDPDFQFRSQRLLKLEDRLFQTYVRKVVRELNLEIPDHATAH